MSVVLVQFDNGKMSGERGGVMGFNPSKRVAAVRAISREFGFDQVIIIGIDNKKNIMASASYGETKKSCEECKELAEAAYDAVFEKIDEIR